MATDFDPRAADISVSIVMPCLNEAAWLAACIDNARACLLRIEHRFGLKGEVLIADNGSTDGGPALAVRMGARVVRVAEPGYGAALRGGFAAAQGRYLIMGDADGSYDFTDAVEMVGALMAGADLCMGSRFKGGIKPGAMPWKNRYIGNPLLTGILNILFKAKVSDAHCGLRALTKACFERLRLTGAGMEFASEMVIKAALTRETFAEAPCTLSPDLRDRAPHLRPWRDGWRHLRYMFMLSPAWLFAAPAAFGLAVALPILLLATIAFCLGQSQTTTFGNYWIVFSAALVGLSHLALLMAFAAHLYGVREGYRLPKAATKLLARWITLESMLGLGAVSSLVGLGVLLTVTWFWSARQFGPTYSILPAVVGMLMITLGAQNVLGGFLLAILGGNEASFLRSAVARRPVARRLEVEAEA